MTCTLQTCVDRPVLVGTVPNFAERLGCPTSYKLAPCNAVRVGTVRRRPKFYGAAAGCPAPSADRPVLVGTEECRLGRRHAAPSRVLQNDSRVFGTDLSGAEQCGGRMVALSRSEVSLCVSPVVLCLLPHGWCQNVSYQV